MERVLRDGPSHPLCLAATGLLLLNDHLLKGLFPGLVTGKLSDLAWLVVMPVVLAALAVRLEFRPRVIPALALGTVALVFCLLQLVPPFGDALAWAVGGRNVADPTDLLTLPALALAPLCWREHRRVPMALPVAAFACVATSRFSCEDHRLPGPDAVDVDRFAPLILTDGDFSEMSTDAPGVMSQIRVFPEAGGQDLELIGTWRGSRMGICPRDGLEPGTTYVWVIREPNDLDGWHAVRAGLARFAGRSRFTTGQDSAFRAGVTNEQECYDRLFDPSIEIRCRDTADTADTADTGGAQ